MPSEAANAGLIVSPETFESHLKALKDAGLYISHNLEIVTIFVLFVIGVAAYGAATANKKIILTQGGPAILAILSILLFK